MELKQTQQQQMKMAPMLFEAISLLQYNQMDLNAYLKEKALENPLIEFKESERLPIRVSRSHGTTISTTDVIENTLMETVSYRDELKQQARLIGRKDVNTDILLDVIDNLDERGYWKDDLEDWAETMAYELKDVEVAFEALRSLDPAGVGAQNLQDCLLLQVKRLQNSNKALIIQIISDYLDLLAEENWQLLSEQVGASSEELMDAYNTIRGLSPFPVKGMETEPVHYIVPDLTLEKIGQRFYLKLDQGTLPKLSVNKSYYNHLLSAVHEKKDRSYVQKKFSEADWLMKGLARREETLQKIAVVLTDFHGGALSKSPEHWPPLTLKEVADEVGIHESTVSRAIKDKYVKTDTGLLELKQFFPKGMKQGPEKGVSVMQIKEWLRIQIQLEDPTHPLSDQDLSDWLAASKGIYLSRRAVAKYRMEMHLASSMKRRKR